jgi:hypothetical protein
MFFVPGIDDTPGFWESHPAWWQYWGDIIDGASVWESAWPQVHGTNEGDLSKDVEVMGPLQKKSKVFMMRMLHFFCQSLPRLIKPFSHQHASVQECGKSIIDTVLEAR